MATRSRDCLRWKECSQITDYIDLVESGKVEVCEDQLQLIDLVKDAFENEDIYIDYDLLHGYKDLEALWPFELFEWEWFLLTLWLCTFRPNGLPRWPTLFLYVGRGAGKNGFLAFAAFCLSSKTNGIAYYDIDICANSEEQAKTSFNDVYEVLDSPKHRKRFERSFRWNKTIIENKTTKSKIRYRTDNPKTKDGLRSGAVFFDEVHEYANYDNISVFTGGLGKKPHPRRAYATTDGNVRDGVLDDLKAKAKKILERKNADNGFLPFVCRLDNEDEVNDKAKWPKANPSLPYFPNLMTEIEDEYLDYCEDPIQHAEFMTKRMNLPKGRADTEVTSWENVLKTNRPVPDIKGKTCVAGIDYASTNDIVSAFILFKHEGDFCGLHHSWMCARSKDIPRIKFPLKEMEKRGLLTMVDAVEVDPDLPALWIDSFTSVATIKKITIDLYRHKWMSRSLRDIGFSDSKKAEKEIVIVRPSDIMKIQPVINSAFVRGSIVWGDDPMMRWFVNNTKLEPAQHGNFTYGKIERKSRKTDGFSAFVGAMTLEEELPEVSETVFIPPLIF